MDDVQVPKENLFPDVEGLKVPLLCAYLTKGSIFVFE